MTKKKEKEMTKAEAIDGLRRMGATVASYDHIYTDPITGIQTLVVRPGSIKGPIR